MKLSASALLISTLFLASCSADNRFKTYYGSYASNPQAVAGAEGQPKVIETLDLEGKVELYKKINYRIIGTSSFDGGWEPRAKAIDFAESIGASIVITSSNYTGSISRQFSITVPTTSTSYHSGTIYDNQGSISSFSGTTSTYGSQEYKRSFNVGQYYQEAVFMAKNVEE
jgi:hypothetical protein